LKDVVKDVVAPNTEVDCETNAFTMEAVVGGSLKDVVKDVVKDVINNNVVTPNMKLVCKTNAFTMEAVAASGCTTDFRTTLADDSIGGSAGESLKNEVKDIGIVITPNTKVCETLSIWMISIHVCTFTCIMIHLAIFCPLTTCIRDAGSNGTKGTDENNAYRTISTAVGNIITASLLYPIACILTTIGRAAVVAQKRPKKRQVTLVVRMKSDWKRWVLLLCLPLNVMGYDSVPNGDGSSSDPGTGLRKVVSDWTAGGALKDAVVAKYGEIENWSTSEVTNLAYVFYGKSSFNADISKWVVSRVTSLSNSTSFLANC
jgi:hypothetical protein